MALPGPTDDVRPLVRGARVSSLSNVAEDIAVEHGNIAASQLSSYANASDAAATAASRSGHDRAVALRACWSMNYQEASIYLQEGRNNEKFDTHPRGHDALPQYLVAHHRFFHVVDVMASLLLLSLAALEPPTAPGFKVPIGVHGALEILGILVLSLDVVLKVRWQGLRKFIRHKRSMCKCILLAVMLVEAVVVIVRHANHIRVTRSLRPLFLFDTYYCSGVRRFVRQLLQSLPPILDMLFLLLFFQLIFTILGYYLFSSVENSPYFVTFQESFVSLFVLLTTANFPDVMLPAYAKSRFAAIYFISYLTVLLYFLMNLLLAVVYDTFSGLEKEKMKKLILHERSACEQAYRLLISQVNDQGVSLRHFFGLMSFYMPQADARHVYLTFKSLNTSRTGILTLDEFYNIFLVQNLSWKEKSVSKLWFHSINYSGLRTCFSGLNRLVKWKWFEYFIYAVISANFGIIIIEAIRSSTDGHRSNDYHHMFYISLAFVLVYVIEAFMKIAGLGSQYFFNAWNVIDFIITVVSVVGVLGELFDVGFLFVLVLRPIRLLRLFKIKKRYRDIVETLFMLSARLWSLAISIVMLYYFYAIIGMEVFSEYELRNCCKNSSVEQYFVYMPNTSLYGYYYFNNFANVFESGVTLFELTVVNNWYIIMDAYAIHVSSFTRIYFMVFYLTMMVVMTIVVAFILEAFVFKIQYGKAMTDRNDLDYVRYEQTLSTDEIDMLRNVDGTAWSGRFIREGSDEERLEDMRLEGSKRRRRIELSMQMYQNEIKEWIERDTDSVQEGQVLLEHSAHASRRSSANPFATEPSASDVPLSPPSSHTMVPIVQHTSDMPFALSLSQDAAAPLPDP